MTQSSTHAFPFSHRAAPPQLLSLMAPLEKLVRPPVNVKPRTVPPPYTATQRTASGPSPYPATVSFSVSGAPTINVLSAPSSETSVTPLATTAREAVFAALPANDAACLIVPSPYSPGATWTVSPDLW